MRAIFTILTLTLFVFYSCKSNRSSANKLYSEDFTEQTERIEKLREEVVFFSGVKDAEFVLVNANGFHNQRISVPGASSWDYKFAIKINPLDIPKWTEGMTDTLMINDKEGWLENVVLCRKQNWQISKESKPKFYVRKGENVIMAVFEKEGIIYKRVVNM